MKKKLGTHFSSQINKKIHFSLFHWGNFWSWILFYTYILHTCLLYQCDAKSVLLKLLPGCQYMFFNKFVCLICYFVRYLSHSMCTFFVSWIEMNGTKDSSSGVCITFLECLHLHYISDTIQPSSQMQLFCEVFLHEEKFINANYVLILVQEIVFSITSDIYSTISFYI